MEKKIRIGDVVVFTPFGKKLIGQIVESDTTGKQYLFQDDLVISHDRVNRSVEKIYRATEDGDLMLVWQE